MEQKTIGMIGGVSWESTVLYYKQINQLIREHFGNLHSAQIVLHSLNYEPIIRLEQEDRWAEIGEQLAKKAKDLEQAGADFVLLCCNTLHKVAPSIEQAIDIPFLHIADAAGKELVRQNIQKIGLLGTQFTMEDGFYASRLKDRFDLDVLVPDLTDRQETDRIIYQELCQGKITSSAKQTLIQIIQSLQEKGAEAILLGCTELGLLITQQDASIPVYDTTVLHVQEAVRQALQ